MKMINAGPNDPEAQKMIADEIKKQLINKEYETAMENNPEFFGNVTMLYVATILNGHPMQAFVDSGAQITIISKKCAE